MGERSIDEIIAELDQPYTGRLPEEAIRAAQRRTEEITPRLIDLIRAATATVRSGDDQPGNGHLFALYLLTEFRAQEALPAIVEAISLPGEGPFDLFGDVITEDLSRMLAALAADAPTMIDELIADRSLNEYVRSAAIQTYFYWVSDGRLSRDQAVERLREHLRSAIANQDEQVAGVLVAELTSYVPTEAREEIEEAFRRDLIDRWYIDEEEVQESLAGGEPRYQKVVEARRPTGIADTVAELSEWYAYQDNDPGIDDLPFSPQETFDDWRTGLDSEDRFEMHATIRNMEPKVGRNEPCPCGSGKKYKKCCGSAR